MCVEAELDVGCSVTGEVTTSRLGRSYWKSSVLAVTDIRVRMVLYSVRLCYTVTSFLDHRRAAEGKNVQKRIGFICDISPYCSS